MIKKIELSEKDVFNLSGYVERDYDKTSDLDYSGLVVNKPWGYEYLLYEDKKVAIWMLYIKKGHSTSMHCHPKKKSCLLILSGNALSSTLNNNFNLKEKDALIIDKGVFHKTEAVSDNGTFLIELETPPNKNDLFRLKDNYKRENQGYTLEKNITDKTYNYNYLFLNNKNNSNGIFGRYKFAIRDFKNKEPLTQLNADLVLLLSGTIHADAIYHVGDLIERDKIENATIEGDARLLLIRERKNLVRVSDYIISFLKKNDINNAFMVAGGKIMFLLESMRSQNMNYMSNYHEQASAMAAEAYAKFTNKLGLAIVTGGSGGTNALTGVAGAWVDSTPMIIISGQSYNNQTVGTSGLRQLGVHELNIVDVVRPITKYAVMVKDEEKISYHLEKALHLATSGRPGPVWIDVPIDIQMAMIEENELEHFKIPQQLEIDSAQLSLQIREIIPILQKSKRPILLLGNGVRLSDAEQEFLALAKILSFPIVTSLKASDLILDDHPLYAGRGGIIGQRATNFAIQNSDLVLCIGGGIGLSISGWAYNDFAREAIKIAIDIDKSELEKRHVKPDFRIICDAKKFIVLLMNQLKDYAPNEKLKDWKEKIAYWKVKYPILLDEWKNGKRVNSNNFIDILSQQLNSQDVIVADTATALQSAVQSLKLKWGQRFITSSGLGAPGFGLPGAIGACVGNNLKRTICLIGDGALQFNVQELETIEHNKLPIKIFVFDNKGYSHIRSLQKRYFGNTLGVDINSGLSMPSIEKLALAYGIQSNIIETNDMITKKIQEALNYPGPFICKIQLSEDEQTLLRQGSFHRPDGKTVPRPIEDMFPYLEREELEKEMIIDPVYFDPYKE